MMKKKKKKQSLECSSNKANVNSKECGDRSSLLTEDLNNYLKCSNR